MIRASTISMLMFPVKVKACSVNQRFQESDALRPDWRLVLVHQATPKLPKDQFRRVCYDAIDLIVSAIAQRFNQESFSSYAQMETLLVKTANGDDYDTEFKFLEASYSEDVDTGALPRLATKYFGSYVKGEDIMLFPEPEKELIQEVQTICKLPAINPATSAAWKRSFSSQCTASEDVVSIRDG